MYDASAWKQFVFLVQVSQTRFRKSIDRARVPVFQRALGSNSKELIGQPSSSSAPSPADRQPPMLLAVCHPPRTHLVAVYVRRSHRNTVLSFGRISLKRTIKRIKVQVNGTKNLPPILDIIKGKMPWLIQARSAEQSREISDKFSVFKLNIFLRNAHL